ncbi:voltage-dependent calcium channel subunit alpha-2/delta-3 isoform X2 [Hetaerina americana]|uniref:voltage-dependent calcium channel subunit alpha-2/delta-3 isoform X2 n=1 Tax=Hetaerina americana TaxID=62018 RepID=UPI003A7F104F
MVLSRWTALAALLLSAFVPYTLEQDEDIPHNEVKNWALKFGVDLWEFGRQFTKMNKIQRKYQELETQVSRKDGLLMIREMAQEVKNMMEIKMSALTRLMEAAEQAALAHKFDRHSSLSYVNSRRLNDYSAGGDSGGGEGRGGDGGSSGGDGDGGVRGDEGGDINLFLDPHFGYLPVNSNFSCVLLPSEVHERASDVRNAIKWSEYLDQVFVGNYELDPTLTWQYFGSAHGFLRRYPANKWPVGAVSSADEDFRTAQWYLSAATSPKDLIILFDASGSMSGSRRELARATASAILDTLGADDFVNILRFADTTESIVPCFKDMLVQGSRTNIRELRNALDNVKPENIANFSSALITAFELLHKYNRTGQGSQCNQAIMIITDGAPHSFREIFKQYNWPHMPVRVFTYLVGKDAVNAPDLNWMACANKGYFVQISSTHEVRNKVLQYIEVMARPMVMYQNDHPVQWSPVFADTKSGCVRAAGSNCPDYQLMTTVSTPIFDRRNYSVRVANLLGVVGIDVPIQQIKKLVPPYKLGVNGYSFIVDNNGHVLYHPDLRPLVGGSNKQNSLKPEPSAVDITEVELIDNKVSYEGDKSGVRENNSLLLDMRHEMIDQKEGETELNVKVHCDSMRRVTTRRQKYFYHPIEGTPFSLGVALPDNYGIYEVQGEEEIKHSFINVSEYFEGSNWKVHPDWVYCEYNHESEHVFHTPEEQVIHFIARTRKPGWKWMSVRPRSPQHEKERGHNTPKKMERDSYFCDKTLLQSLVFDALVTDGLERNVAKPVKEDKQQGYQMFGVMRSFIATRSGLLRWVDHKGTNSARGGTPTSSIEEPPDSSSNFFGESNRRAIDEVWYKRAVEQYEVEPDSFVFTVDFEAGDAIMSGDPNYLHKTLVTATHAVFVDHKGYRAPAAVVGLQFKHSALASQFLNITSTCLGPLGCRKTCASEELDCYVLDSNGFVIISEETSHTGKFFGEIDGTIMDSLVQDRIYRKVSVWDHQGACTDDHSPFSDSSCRLEPLGFSLHGAVGWALSRLSWLAFYTGLPQIWNPHRTEAQPTGDDISDLAEEDYDYNEEDEEGEAEEEEEEEDDEGDSNGTGGEDDEGDSNGTGGGSSALPPPPPPAALPPPPPPPPTPTPPTTNRSTPWREGGGWGGGSSSGGWGSQHYPRKWPHLTQTYDAGPTSDARPCNKRTDLYILQPERLNTSGLFNPLKGKLTNCHVTGCERPFSVQKIPHSNLILLVVDTLCPCGSKLLSIVPREVVPGAGASVSGATSASGNEVLSPSSSPSTPPASSPANGGSGGSHCPRPKDALYRRRPPKCMNYHPEESEIRLCGGSGSLRSTVALLPALLIIWSAVIHFLASISS